MVCVISSMTFSSFTSSDGFDNNLSRLGSSNLSSIIRVLYNPVVPSTKQLVEF